MDDRYVEIITHGKKHKEPVEGAVFGGLTVLGRSGKRQKSIALFKARCVCGGVVEVTASSLERNRNGCQGCRTNKRLLDEVFNGDRALYKSVGNRYRGIMARVYNTSHHQYKDYGGRGIRVCQEWVESRDSFFRYVASLEGFKNMIPLRLQIDRIDNDKGYEPGNIRLVQADENSKNRRTTKFVEREGVRYTAKQFRDLFCPRVPKNRFYQLVRENKDSEALLSRCVEYKPRKIKPSSRGE